MERVKIGLGVSSIGRSLPLIGKAAGLFDKENLLIEVVNQQDEEKIVSDIVAHETPIGTPNAPSLIFSLLSGNDLVIVGGVLNRPAFYLAANSSIRVIADLKDKRIGINQPRRMAGMMMLALLRRWGLDAQRDVQLIDLGLNDRSMEALADGHIDAALLPPEKAFVAEEEGFFLVADSLDLDCHWVPLATTRRFLEANRTLVTKVASVYSQSISLFKTEPEVALREIGYWLPALAKRPSVLQRCHDLFARSFEPSLLPSLTSTDSILREVALQDGRAKEIRAAAVIEKVI